MATPVSPVNAPHAGREQRAVEVQLDVDLRAADRSARGVTHLEVDQQVPPAVVGVGDCTWITVAVERRIETASLPPRLRESVTVTSTR